MPLAHSVSAVHAWPYWRLQAPAPLHARSYVPSVTQGRFVPPTVASWYPGRMNAHVPSGWPVSDERHDLHVTMQAALQQTPSMHGLVFAQLAPVSQSSPRPHLTGHAEVFCPQSTSVSLVESSTPLLQSRARPQPSSPTGPHVRPRDVHVLQHLFAVTPLPHVLPGAQFVSSMQPTQTPERQTLPPTVHTSPSGAAAWYGMSA